MQMQCTLNTHWYFNRILHYLSITNVFAKARHWYGRHSFLLLVFSRIGERDRDRLRPDRLYAALRMGHRKSRLCSDAYS